MEPAYYFKTSTEKTENTKLAQEVHFLKLFIALKEQ
jgi:hypothetical protein